MDGVNRALGQVGCVITPCFSWKEKGRGISHIELDNKSLRSANHIDGANVSRSPLHSVLQYSSLVCATKYVSATSLVLNCESSG